MRAPRSSARAADHLIGKPMTELFVNYATPYPRHHGVMSKRGKWNRSYKPRWFVYHEASRSLLYTASYKPAEKCKGAAPVQQHARCALLNPSCCRRHPSHGRLVRGRR
jgi:hypothetical protein